MSNKEQLSIFLRYVDVDGVHEVFIEFAEVKRIGGYPFQGLEVSAMMAAQKCQ